jgi:hypothetical protein
MYKYALVNSTVDQWDGSIYFTTIATYATEESAKEAYDAYAKGFPEADPDTLAIFKYKFIPQPVAQGD